MSGRRPGNVLIDALQYWALGMFVFVLCIPWILDVIYWLLYGLFWVLGGGEME